MHRERRPSERPYLPYDEAKLSSMGYFEFRPYHEIVSKDDLTGAVRLYIGNTATSHGSEHKVAVILDVDAPASNQLFMAEFSPKLVEQLGEGDFAYGSLRLLEIFSQVRTDEGDASEFCEAQQSLEELEK